MKVALIGNGGIAVQHRKAYQMLAEEGSDVTLVAVCDIRAERRTEEVCDGARAYPSVDELLASEHEIDYVDICLPTFLHAEYAVKCLEAGLNVLCEKPMALTVEDAQTMLDAAQRTGKRLMIAHSSRFLNTHQMMKHYVREGRLGKPLSVFLNAADNFPRGSWNDWFADNRLSGGAMLDLQAHHIDLINMIFGVPQEVSVVAMERGNFKGYSSCSANLIYDGMFAHIWTDWSVPKNRYNNRTFRINFEHGYVYILKHEPGGIVIVDEEGNETRPEIVPHFRLGTPSYYNEIVYFADCLRNGAPFDLCPPEESIRVISVMRAEEASADRHGAPVRVTCGGEA